jgi:hypothetical protein
VSLGRVAAIARQDLRILRTDPMAVVPLIVLPLVVAPFLQPAFKAAFHFAGLHRATGAEQVVPGMAVTFGIFLVMNISSSFFREHAWKTWDRLRASPAGTAEILLGKMVTPLLELTLQFVLLFGFAGLLLGLHLRGSWLELCAVGCCFAVFLVHASQRRGHRRRSRDGRVCWLPRPVRPAAAVGQEHLTARAELLGDAGVQACDLRWQNRSGADPVSACVLAHFRPDRRLQLPP